MIYKMPACQPGYIRVVFELPSCVWADHIGVTGTFSNWDSAGLPMTQDRDGVWRAVMELPAGQRYEFRYVIDGRWQTDYHADGYAENDFGSDNSILDLTLVVALAMNTRQSSQVPDGHVVVAPYLPVPSEGLRLPVRSRTQSAAEMPRLRPRIAAA